MLSLFIFERCAGFNWNWELRARSDTMIKKGWQRVNFEYRWGLWWRADLSSISNAKIKGHHFVFGFSQAEPVIMMCQIPHPLSLINCLWKWAVAMSYACQNHHLKNKNKRPQWPEKYYDLKTPNKLLTQYVAHMWKYNIQFGFGLVCQ